MCWKVYLYIQEFLTYPTHSNYKNYLNYFGTVYADVTQVMKKEDVLSGETTVKEIDETER